MLIEIMPIKLNIFAINMTETDFAHEIFEKAKLFPIMLTEYLIGFILLNNL